MDPFNFTKIDCLKEHDEEVCEDYGLFPTSFSDLLEPVVQHAQKILQTPCFVEKSIWFFRTLRKCSCPRQKKFRLSLTQTFPEGKRRRIVSALTNEWTTPSNKVFILVLRMLIVAEIFEVRNVWCGQEQKGTTKWFSSSGVGHLLNNFWQVVSSVTSNATLFLI